MALGRVVAWSLLLLVACTGAAAVGCGVVTITGGSGALTNPTPHDGVATYGNATCIWSFSPSTTATISLRVLEQDLACGDEVLVYEASNPNPIAVANCTSTHFNVTIEAFGRVEFRPQAATAGATGVVVAYDVINVTNPAPPPALPPPPPSPAHSACSSYQIYTDLAGEVVNPVPAQGQTCVWNIQRTGNTGGIPLILVVLQYFPHAGDNLVFVTDGTQTISPSGTYTASSYIRVEFSSQGNATGTLVFSWTTSSTYQSIYMCDSSSYGLGSSTYAVGGLTVVSMPEIPVLAFNYPPNLTCTWSYQTLSTLTGYLYVGQYDLAAGDALYVGNTMFSGPYDATADHSFQITGPTQVRFSSDALYEGAGIVFYYGGQQTTQCISSGSDTLALNANSGDISGFPCGGLYSGAFTKTFTITNSVSDGSQTVAIQIMQWIISAGVTVTVYDGTTSDRVLASSSTDTAFNLLRTPIGGTGTVMTIVMTGASYTVSSPGDGIRFAYYADYRASDSTTGSNDRDISNSNNVFLAAFLGGFFGLFFLIVCLVFGIMYCTVWKKRRLGGSRATAPAPTAQTAGSGQTPPAERPPPAASPSAPKPDVRSAQAIQHTPGFGAPAPGQPIYDPPPSYAPAVGYAAAPPAPIAQYGAPSSPYSGGAPQPYTPQPYTPQPYAPPPSAPPAFNVPPSYAPMNEKPGPAPMMAPQPAFCGSCGAPRVPNARFCAGCGATL